MRKMVLSGSPGVFFPGTIEIASTHSGLACGFELAAGICRRSSQALSILCPAGLADGLARVSTKNSWPRIDAMRRRKNAAARRSIWGARLPQVGRTCKLCVISKTAERMLKTTKPTTMAIDRKSTRLNSSHLVISYAVFCLKKKIAARGAALDVLGL